MTAPCTLAETSALHPPGALRTHAGAPDKGRESLAAQRDEAARTPLTAFQIGMHWFPERPGGLDRHYHALAGALPGAGVAVRGMVAGSGAAAADTHGAIVAFAPPGASVPMRLLHARRTLREMLARNRPDVVVSHFALYTLPGLDLIRAYPTVMHFQGPWAAESQAEGAADLASRIQHRIEAAVYARCQLHIVMSMAFGRVLETRYGVDPARIRIVPGCVDAARFGVPMERRSARQALDLPTDRPIVLTVRRLVRRMGLGDLVDAMATVRKHVPDALLLIVGRGTIEAELRERIAAMGLQHHVRLMGALPDAQLPLVYRAADLSVVPTLMLEGFGLTTLESLAAGTPVLVTPVGGLPEAVSDLSGSLVLQASGVAALAAGLTDALRGTLRLPDAEACRAYARSRFDIPVIAAKTAQVYREAVNRCE
ncbi:glycosyltransferase family 4 protein [Sorangium sp. So ce381]